MDSLLEIAFPLLGIAATAFVVVQAVRIVNRRGNRRTIASAAAVLTLLVLYVAAFAPAYWWEMETMLDVAFPVVGIATAVFVVLQVVRIVNRRQKRRTIAWAAAVVALLTVYVISFGPAYWWQHSSRSRAVTILYAPLVETAWRSPSFVVNGLWWYATSAGHDDDMWLGCGPLWRNGPRVWRDGPRALSWSSDRERGIHHWHE